MRNKDENREQGTNLKKKLEVKQGKVKDKRIMETGKEKTEIQKGKID